MQTLEALGNFISQIGFPTFCCLYLLLRFEKIIISLDKSVRLLIHLIENNLKTD